MEYELKTALVYVNDTIDIPTSAICVQLSKVNIAARPREYKVQWLKPIERVQFRGR